MSGNVWVGGKPKDNFSALHATMGCYAVNILSSDISEMMSLNLHLLVSIKCSLHHCLLRIPSHFAPCCLRIQGHCLLRQGDTSTEPTYAFYHI